MTEQSAISPLDTERIATIVREQNRRTVLNCIEYYSADIPLHLAQADAYRATIDYVIDLERRMVRLIDDYTEGAIAGANDISRRRFQDWQHYAHALRPRYIDWLTHAQRHHDAPGLLDGLSDLLECALRYLPPSELDEALKNQAIDAKNHVLPSWMPPDLDMLRSMSFSRHYVALLRQTRTTQLRANRAILNQPCSPRDDTVRPFIANTPHLKAEIAGYTETLRRIDRDEAALIVRLQWALRDAGITRTLYCLTPECPREFATLNPDRQIPRIVGGITRLHLRIEEANHAS